MSSVMDSPEAVPVVETRALYKRFGDRTAVDGLDLSVPKGACYGLLGPNGAGKTTTLRMIYGVTRPTSGSVRVFGLDVTRARRAVCARIGVTLQDNVMIDDLTPDDNLRIFGRYHLIDEPQLSARVDELVDFLHLGSHRDVPVRALSGGFKRRLAIAMSLVNHPELLVLDEPTTGLDPAVRLALWTSIRDLRARGTTVLLTTHYMEEAERLCDRVGIVDGGRLIAEGAPRDLIEEHLAPETVELDSTPEEEAELLVGFAPPMRRLRAGSRLILHLADAAALVEHLHALDARCGDSGGGLANGRKRRQLVVRPTTLEDVFLELTGASLEVRA
ncbi:MAG: ABC transporter ATP-binding protein [Myxococcales bacterium]|jgi:lipooligosaccharide transport system ATP-binding protein|nr:MAG: ABC transporter ATP-binding protein [Myxococcales bacterium]